MLAPFSYFFFRSPASLSRWVPVMRAPFFRSGMTSRLLVAVPRVAPRKGIVRPPGGSMIVQRDDREQEIHSMIGERFARTDHAYG
ncbi:hypothetical protein GCM10010210_25590 [Pseudonocardia hydrocarbonoxydans]|uniref:Uncharacterized protein n=1 Tax=Pseudonocardia hydrocarbonoxydans TaxID=76726 RepID=A0A4Y3WGY3_9PSEU|nr:hypothetical protein PHY01_02380 [Pseudonocardia hydrocarbonoxydans]